MAAALKLPVTDVFTPLLPALAVGLVYELAVSYALGKKEEARLAGVAGGSAAAASASRAAS